MNLQFVNVEMSSTMNYLFELQIENKKNSYELENNHLG